MWIEKVSGRAASDILYGQSWSPSAPLLIFTVGITSATYLAGMQAVYWAKPENVHKKDHNLSLRPYLPTGFLGTTNISKVGVVPVPKVRMKIRVKSNHRLSKQMRPQWSLQTSHKKCVKLQSDNPLQLSKIFSHCVIIQSACDNLCRCSQDY